MVKAKLHWLAFAALFALAACSGSSSPLSEREQLGLSLFVQHCAACHSTAGDAVIVGPSLAGIATRAGQGGAGQDAITYIKTSILDPSAYVNEGFNDLMPKSFGTVLTAEELDALVAYLLTFK